MYSKLTKILLMIIFAYTVMLAQSKKEDIIVTKFENQNIKLKEFKTTNPYPKATPKFLNIVESVRSLCKLDISNLVEKNWSKVLDKRKLPSPFSKSIGFTLWGIVDEPISPLVFFNLK